MDVLVLTDCEVVIIAYNLCTFGRLNFFIVL